jgi:hypothetical protein
VSGKPAEFRQRELNQALKAARRIGANRVELNLSSGASIVIPLVPDDDKPAEANEWLESDDAHQA